jgi:hypothetical protein
MSDSLIPESIRTLGRVRGAGVVARLLMLLSPLAMTACTNAAATDLLRPLVIAIGVLTVVCVVHPDTHVGLLMVVVLGIQWLQAVDDPATPWAMAAAAWLAVFHTATAAATVAPPSARWTSSMVRRWCRRAALLVLPGAGTWLVVAALEDHQPAGSSVLITTALLALAAGGVWAGTSGSLRAGSSQHIRRNVDGID